MYTISEIAHIIGGELHGNSNSTITRLQTDSRAITFPEETLFFAIKTGRNDGHEYIEEAYRNQVRNFVIETDFQRFSHLSEANFICIDNSVEALQRLTIHHRNKFDIPVIGITGSNGKTIVKEWIYQLLQNEYKITRSPRSYNSQIGVPFSVWRLDSDTQMGVFEAGISQPGEMEKIAPVINPSIGIFTYLGEAHQENFISLKEKCSEKIKLFKNCPVILYNKDEKLVDICFQQWNANSRFFTYGRTSQADVIITSEKKVSDKTTITYQYKGTEYNYSIPFIHKVSIENSFPCLALMLYLGYSAESIAEKMMELDPIAMRMEVKEGENNCLLINDSYNSDVHSLSIALDFLREQATAKQLNRTLILSDIFQSGIKDDSLYEMVAKMLEEKEVNRFVGIGTELLKHKDLFKVNQSQFYPDTESFLKNFDATHFHSEAILLKGARKFRFEEITDKLATIVHETILEVNLSALIRNFNYFRSFLNSGTKIMSMVKANAYGSGDVEVAKTLQHNGCDYLAVAVADEGAILRKEGIHLPIVVMNPELNSFPKIFENNLEPEVYSFQLLEKIINEAEKQGITDYPIHLKLDTGMHRLGFEEKDIERLIGRLKSQNAVKIRSLFSHLVGSDSADFDTFTMMQIEKFQTMRTQIEGSFRHKILAHILNSAGIERFNSYQFDMVRLGIGHYGMSAAANNVLEEVCTLKTKILQIRKVSASDTIGYSRKGVLKRDSIIGAIPIGYADGLNRKLGNYNGRVLVNDHFAPFVGNICMDVCMIDLTDVPQVKEGDDVIIFGKGNSIQDVAQLLETIPYEVLAGISKRVKRVYFKE